MHLRHKQFPYPVIANGNDSYVDTSFITDAAALREGYNIRFIFEAFVDNLLIKELIDDDKIAYVHHIECAQTCYRTAVKANEEKFEIVIPESRVNGHVEICSFLAAETDIKNYTNTSFSSDYKGFKFDIDKGCIMGIGTQINLRINKERDDLAKTSSIFSIVANMDPNEKNVRIDMGKKTKIVILLPQDSRNRYKNISESLELQPVMHQMIILPALMYVLEELKSSKEELYNFEDCRWFRSLRKVAKKFDVAFDEEGFLIMDTYQLAQQLLDTPLTRALINLSGVDEE